MNPILRALRVSFVFFVIGQILAAAILKLQVLRGERLDLLTETGYLGKACPKSPSSPALLSWQTGGGEAF